MEEQNIEIEFTHTERDTLAYEIVTQLEARKLTYLQALNVLESAQLQLRQCGIVVKQ